MFQAAMLPCGAAATAWGFGGFRDALMGNQSTHHFHFTQAGFNIQVLLQKEQRQKHSESPSSPRVLPACPMVFL